MEVTEPQFPHLHQVVMKVIADTLCTTYVTRLLEPRLNAVSEWPWLRDWAGTAVHTWRAWDLRPASLYHSSHPTGELGQQSCILYLLNSYFRKFNIKWQMNANYTSFAQLKLEMLSTGSCSNPNHSSRAYISKDLSLVPRGWQKAYGQTAQPGATPHVLRYQRAHTAPFWSLKVRVGEQHRQGLPKWRARNGLKMGMGNLWNATLRLLSGSLTSRLLCPSSPAAWPFPS